VVPVRALFLIATLSLGACYFDVDEIDVPADLSAIDIQPDLTGIDFTSDGPHCSNGTLPFHAGELTDPPLDRWGAAVLTPTVTNPMATVVLDPARKVAGQGSLRFDTNNDQAGIFYPATRDANFDVHEALFLSFSITAQNTSAPAWQGAQPHVLLLSGPSDYLEYVPEIAALPTMPGDFMGMTVPLDGGFGWTRNQFGAPDLRHIKYFAITFDSWGAGFTVWIDNLQIGPSQFLDCGQ
jgi:hypothetical protein